MELWEAAMQYLNVPFRHRGRTKNGLDCVGLVILAGKDIGFVAQDLRVYGREPWDDGLENYLKLNLGDPVDREPLPNDVLLLRLHRDVPPSHVAICAPYPYPGTIGMVHTYGEIGRVVYHRMDDRRRNQIAGVYQWPAKH